MSKSPPGWDRQTTPPKGSPHGWIQWKGTQVCMDIRCSCGVLSHVDDEFTYYVECPSCHQRYMVNGHIELVPLTADEGRLDGYGVAVGIK
jgi:hypothetical protein